MDIDYDVVVIGGGAAGLAAAIALTRSRRSVLVVDGGEPRNAPADGVHNFLSREGTPPLELLADGRRELRGYGGEVRTGRVTSLVPEDPDFLVDLDDGAQLRARRVVVATGLVDVLPDVAGLRERWGRDVLHCPYCHGWEVRDQAIAVLATTLLAVHQALMFRQLSDDVTVIAHDVELDEESRRMLEGADIRLVQGPAESVRITEDRLSGVHLGSGEVVPLQALVVGPRMEVRSDVLAGLGIEPDEHPSGMGTQVMVDETGQTSHLGVYAAGNLTDISAQVMGAAAAGTRVGAAVNIDLIMSDLREELLTR